MKNESKKKAKNGALFPIILGALLCAGSCASANDTIDSYKFYADVNEFAAAYNTYIENFRIIDRTHISDEAVSDIMRELENMQEAYEKLKQKVREAEESDLGALRNATDALNNADKEIYRIYKSYYRPRSIAREVRNADFLLSCDYDGIPIEVHKDSMLAARSVAAALRLCAWTRADIYQKIKGHGIRLAVFSEDAHESAIAGYYDSRRPDYIWINLKHAETSPMNEIAETIYHELEHWEMHNMFALYERELPPSGKFVCRLFEEMCAFRNQDFPLRDDYSWRGNEDITLIRDAHLEKNIKGAGRFSYDYYVKAYYEPTETTNHFIRNPPGSTEEAIALMLAVADRDINGISGDARLDGAKAVKTPRDIALAIWNRLPKKIRAELTAADREFAKTHNIPEAEEWQFFFYASRTRKAAYIAAAEGRGGR